MSAGGAAASVTPSGSALRAWPTYTVLRGPREVLFGRGVLEVIGWAASRLGRRPLLCIDPYLPDQTRLAVLDSLTKSGMTPVVVSEPFRGSTVALVEDAVAAGASAKADVVLAVGGGTTLDLGKLVALRLARPGPLRRYYGERRVDGPCVPLVSAPTTAGTGSEISPVAVVIDPDLDTKTVISDPWLVPTIALCDPVATLTCPASVTVQAGMDALVNAIESYTSADVTQTPESLTRAVFVGNSPLTRDHAFGAVRLLAESLPRAVANGEDLDAREAVLLGSVRAALAYAQTGTGAVHALAYPVESATGLSHGLSVGLLLPYVLAYNGVDRQADHARMARAAKAGMADEADETAAASLVAWVVGLKATIGVPAGLADVGLDERSLDRIADEAHGLTRLVVNNGRPVDRPALRRILDAALAGDPWIAAVP